MAIGEQTPFDAQLAFAVDGHECTGQSHRRQVGNLQPLFEPFLLRFECIEALVLRFGGLFVLGVFRLLDGGLDLLPFHYRYERPRQDLPGLFHFARRTRRHQLTRRPS